MKKAVIVSGYFNPIHKGHIEYFNLAAQLGDILIVIVNSDYQRELKGSKKFQDEDERLFIVKQLRIVDHCFLSLDKDRSVSNTIRFLYSIFGSKYELSFANGGDQENKNIPELTVCKELGIELIDGLGSKIQSSSWLLSRL